jgi:hypothetical protein
MEGIKVSFIYLKLPFIILSVCLLGDQYYYKIDPIHQVIYTG